MPNSISPNSATITGRQGAGALRAILPAAHKAANPTVYENMTASRQAMADHGTRARESYDNPTYTGAHNNWARQDTTATTTACVKMRGARRLPLRIGVLFCETMTFLFILDQAGWTAADCRRWACGMVAGTPRASSPMPCLVSGYLSATIGGAAGKHCRSPEGTQVGGLADHGSGPPAWAGVYGAGWHQAVTLCWLPLPAWADLSSSGVTIALHQTPIPAPESSGRMAIPATCDDSVAQLTDTRQLRNRMSGIRPSCDRVITQRRDYPHANGIRWTRYDSTIINNKNPPLPTGSSRPCPLRDSNPQARRRWILSPLRLPIPPRGQLFYASMLAGQMSPRHTRNQSAAAQYTVDGMVARA